ncbi:MAG TPA: carboxypeptidase-like regulatory domain-containing protein, partial [Bryobacteraceae bacterium]|nr:carboxypeptidase-like regulatory domain-containing protein [Bryobacteraceae bacterium]
LLTDEKGEFKFAGLLPDVYSVRVTLATFVPALRRGILVQPGMRSLLAVDLSTLFSSIELAYPPRGSGGVMSDDWKWVLRGSSSTRPVLRFAGDSPAAASGRDRAAAPETRGILSLAAGDPSAAGGANEADLGAMFALSTSAFGDGTNALEVSGNLGVATMNGMPVSAFRTGYRLNAAGDGAEFALTVRQIYVPGRVGGGMVGASPGAPLMRSVSTSYNDRKQLSGNLSLQYGFTMDSVSFLDRTTNFSPYGRLTYALPDGDELAFVYTAGDARPGLAAAGDATLEGGLNSLGMFPRISVRGGRSTLQRGSEYELNFKHHEGTREWQASAYAESVVNAALDMVAPVGFYGAADLLPDLFGGNSIFNAGSYQSSGYTAGLTQDLGNHLSASVTYASMGALTVANRQIPNQNPNTLRSMIRPAQKQAVAARLEAKTSHTGTRVIASYELADNGWAMPGRLYATDAAHPMPGFNIYLRQAVPFISGRSCRVEATADLRNLLAQGYLSLNAKGQDVLLVETPRSLRAGLNFLF